MTYSFAVLNGIEIAECIQYFLSQMSVWVFHFLYFQKIIFSQFPVIFDSILCDTPPHHCFLFSLFFVLLRDLEMLGFTMIPAHRSWLDTISHDDISRCLFNLHISSWLQLCIICLWKIFASLLLWIYFVRIYSINK